MADKMKDYELNQQVYVPWNGCGRGRINHVAKDHVQVTFEGGKIIQFYFSVDYPDGPDKYYIGQLRMVEGGQSKERVQDDLISVENTMKDCMAAYVEAQAMSAVNQFNISQGFPPQYMAEDFFRLLDEYQLDKKYRR